MPWGNLTTFSRCHSSIVEYNLLSADSNVVKIEISKSLSKIIMMRSRGTRNKQKIGELQQLQCIGYDDRGHNTWYMGRLPDT